MAFRPGWRSAAVLLVFAIVPACDSGNQMPVSGLTGTTSTAALRGEQIVPAVATAATGTATVTVIDQKDEIHYSFSTAGLAAVTAATINLGDPGTNGPPIFLLNSPAGTLTPADLMPAAGASSFHSATAAILAGKTYIVLATTLNPKGEIRGQIGAAMVAASKLTGFQTVPAVNTSVRGAATFQLSAAQDQIDVTLTFIGVTTATSAQINVAAVGVNGPTVFDLSTVAFSSPLTVTLRPADLKPGLPTFEDAVSALLAGALYVEVPNATATIRGQIGAVQLKASLTGAGVVPANASPATGTATIALNGDHTGLMVILTHTLGNPTGVLIRAETAVNNGPIIFDVAYVLGWSTSPLEGFVDAFFLKTQPLRAINNFPDATDAMLTGLTYIEVSSTGFPYPGAEIRGQITP